MHDVATLGVVRVATLQDRNALEEVPRRCAEAVIVDCLPCRSTGEEALPRFLLPQEEEEMYFHVTWN